MNELVVMHNDLVDLPLRRFNASEIDIFHTICFKVKSKNTDEVSISFDDIRKLSHYQKKDEKSLIESIKQTNEKLLDLRLALGDEKNFVQFVLFPTFIIHLEEKKLSVKVNEPFVYLLNNLSGNYTSLELKQSSELKSAYTKQIYKKLQEFKGTGKWIISMSDFRDYLDIPPSFQTGMIDKRIIKPSLEQLTPIFGDLKCNKIRQYGNKGRPRVVGYEWSFKPFTHTKELTEGETDPEKIAQLTGYQKAHRFCPKCHKPMYQKRMQNENGEWIMYGHPDFKTGECKYWTNDLADLLQEYQLPKSDEPDTPEQVKAKNFIAEMINKIFKK